MSELQEPCGEPLAKTIGMTLRDPGLDAIERGLTGIRAEMLAAEQQFASEWKDLAEGRRDSARNLLHYLAMRRRDLRPVQGLLASRGLSSLGRGIWCPD